MRKDLIKQMIDSALDGKGITRRQALELEFFSREELDYLFEGTNRLRDRFKGDDVKICSIVNAKAGKCEEDCGFCAQSSQFKTDSPEYGLMDVEKIVEAAKEAGIPVFTIHNGVSATEFIISAIYVDVKAGGAQKMQKCMDDLGGTGNIAIMTGTIGQDTTNQICGGYEEILANYPDVNIVFEGAGNWGATDAAPLAENWIASGKKLDAIICNNDGMALGALPVLKTTGNVGDILLYGLDATPEALKAVKAGEMAASIFVDAHAEIVKAFELLQILEKGGEVESEYVIPTVLVDASNVDHYLD